MKSSQKVYLKAILSPYGLNVLDMSPSTTVAVRRRFAPGHGNVGDFTLETASEWGRRPTLDQSLPRLKEFSGGRPRVASRCIGTTQGLAPSNRSQRWIEPPVAQRPHGGPPHSAVTIAVQSMHPSLPT